MFSHIIQKKITSYDSLDGRRCVIKKQTPFFLWGEIKTMTNEIAKELLSFYDFGQKQTEKNAKRLHLRSDDFFARIVDAPTRYAFQYILTGRANKREDYHPNRPAVSVEHALKIFNAHNVEPVLTQMDAKTFKNMVNASLQNKLRSPVIRDIFFKDAIVVAQNLERYFRQRHSTFYGWRSQTRLIEIRNFQLESHKFHIVNSSPREVLLNLKTVEVFSEYRDDRVMLRHSRDGMEGEQFVWFCRADNVDCMNTYEEGRSTRENSIVLYISKETFEKKLVVLDNVLGDEYAHDSMLSFIDGIKDDDRFLVKDLR